MRAPRRVVTLLPAATEIVAAVGGGADLVGVSHECDYPEWVQRLPRLTTTPIEPMASAARIDAEVRRLRGEGRPVIAVDGAALRRLGPDLIVTQGLCEVCAVADGEVHRLASLLDPAPETISLSATTLAGIWGDIAAIGRALDLAAEADELVAGLQTRLAALACARPAAAPPRVICIEWLDPLYLAGHWVPELVAAAGGRDVGAEPGTHSALGRWSDLARLEPDVILVMLCGFGVERATRDLDALVEPAGRSLLEAVPVWVLDGNAYTSRPGPRVVDGAERIRAALENRELAGLRCWRPAPVA
ncbi:MAG TPA: ABC transporter substrate-binding protein [Gemmatimonadales bacterium]|nr:ABC transporter substrate-binding protein [Gemmatimonadales bacterium]